MANIEVHLNWRQRLARWLLDKPEFEALLTDEIHEEAELLNRDILVRELRLIDDKHLILAAREKQAFLGNWLLNSAESGADTSA